MQIPVLRNCVQRCHYRRNTRKPGVAGCRTNRHSWIIREKPNWKFFPLMPRRCSSDPSSWSWWRLTATETKAARKTISSALIMSCHKMPNGIRPRSQQFFRSDVRYRAGYFTVSRYRQKTQLLQYYTITGLLVSWTMVNVFFQGNIWLMLVC